MDVKNDNLSHTIEILKQILPEIDWILGHMESSKGWFNLSSQFIDNIISWKIPPWSSFYLDERKLKALGVLCLYDVDTLKSVSDEDVDEFVIQAKQNALEILHISDDLEIPTTDEIHQFFESATEDEKVEFTRQMVLGIYTFLTTTFNYLSLMTFGKTLCQLVIIARSDGDGADKALCQAVQIDRTVLQLDFVQERIMRAQLGSDNSFLEQLGNHIKRPILGGKIRYRKLWLTFAILEDEGFLDMPRESLFDLLQDIGVYGRSFGVEDIGHLTNRLREYREKSKVGQKIFLPNS